MEATSYNDPTRKGGSIQTFSGVIFYPLDPREEDIFLMDVGHGLSNKARFTGHTRRFYSTAEHSTRVSWCLRDMGFDLMTQYVGLHHDDTDAYLPDVPTPLKRLPEFQWFRDLEESMQELCYKRFGAIVTDYKPVKRADVILLLTEKRDLMPLKNHNWDHKYTEVPIPEPYKIEPWIPEVAKKFYLERHAELTHALLQSYPGFRCNSAETLCQEPG
jgi:hypothetical protein